MPTRLRVGRESPVANAGTGAIASLALLIAIACSSEDAAAPEDTSLGPDKGEPRFGNVEDLMDWALPAVVVVDSRYSTASADAASQGSGFFIEPDHVVTNLHVVFSKEQDRFCSQAIVRTWEGDALVVEGIVALDEVHDLAILKVSDGSGSGRRVLPINPTIPRIGEEVFALGAPRGLEFSVSRGVVSAHRMADEDGPIDSVDVFQTDAAVSPGSSGGPLINRAGEVIGVVYATLRASHQNLNFVQYARHLEAAPRSSVRTFEVLNADSSGLGTAGERYAIADDEAVGWPETPEVDGAGWRGWVDRFGSARIPRMVIDLGAGVKMEFAYVGPGLFRMGGDGPVAAENERPERLVEIEHGYWLGTTEVTREQYWRLMGTDPGQHVQDLELPMTGVSWDEAIEYCRRLSLAACVDAGLPSEAEWEYACRAGTEGDYSFVEDLGRFTDAAWFVGNSEGGPRPVRTTRGNDWGMYDMHGNVWEWCADPWHADYRRAPEDGRVWTTLGDTTRRVLRGGGWDSLPMLLRSSFRMNAEPTSRGPSDGFRVRVASR